MATNKKSSGTLIDKDQLKQKWALQFLIVCVLLAALIFGLINSLMYFSDRARAQLAAPLNVVRQNAWPRMPAAYPARAEAREGARSLFPHDLLQCVSQLVALFANSPRCNGASAVKGRPSVAQRPSSQPSMTRSGRHRGEGES